ncbi:hypothetical protein CLV62_101552 [Dysgonomonas alginatilytica]|uniref:Endosialidase-like protein n=1 Tax=Dysgonomonas alginatilytica TaxID=1605892 RepID=A0A2V3PUH5_9BACT|nr:TMF family protein [Dysgonomonas alginatilytica]PXV69283.1 hypothetical protein CLV62_101552 [Dysgonomonas alginatilytica]
MFWVTASSFAQWTTSGNNVTIDKNIGIGISNPVAKLDVNGDINARGNLFLPNAGQIALGVSDTFTYDNKSVGYYSFRWTMDSWNPWGPTLWQSSFAGIKFFTVGRLRLAINQEGNVGIGTSNPQKLLDVKGTIHAQNIEVDLNGWSDFVFDKDYKLPTLQEVENHINEHNHLPDIPSKKQVKEEGINIGEMQAKLLQKIEELTLYVIEQDKTINEQNRRINELEKKLIN